MTTLVIAISAITTGATAAPKSSNPATTGHLSMSAVLLPLRHGVVQKRSATWSHQDVLGMQRSPTAYRERTTHSRAYLKWLKKMWSSRADKTYRLVISSFWLKDFNVTPGSNAWFRAINEVQRPFPGTSSWMISCSHDEGGYGRWVPNSHGSGAGGWLQFLESTFWRMFNAAKTEAQRRGYHVPASASSWYSPLGQAMAGGWAATHGATHEWSGSGC